MKKNNLKIFIISLSCLSIIACKKANEITTVLPIEKETDKVETNLNNELILKLVNDVRTKGCDCKNKETNQIDRMPPVPILTWSNELALVAKSHSYDMDKKNYFSHTNLEGATFGQRLTLAGYTYQTAAENIAMGQKTENEVVNAWLNSYGHCKNIMKAGVKEMGVARTNGKEFYWTQLFGTKK